MTSNHETRFSDIKTTKNSNNIFTRTIGLTARLLATGIVGINLASAEDAMKPDAMKKEGDSLSTRPAY